MATIIFWPATFSLAASTSAPLPLYGFEEALVKSKAEGKFTVLYFWTESCPYCQHFTRQVLTDQQVIDDLNRNFHVVSIDSNRERTLSRRYRVSAVPWLIFLEPGGDPATVLPGGPSAPFFRLFLGYVSTGSYRTMEFDGFVKQIRNN
ncbi:MAG: thioredoxin family protein [Deltaproteobacteria bacterium]|nr:thioredoxin family protein [Deltaproteobacteria bacterium]